MMATVILPLLIQEVQLSVTGESMCISTVERLRGLGMSWKSASSLTDRPAMAFIV